MGTSGFSRTRQPSNTQTDETMPKISEMYAYVVDEGNGDEGIPAWLSPHGVWLPLVGADINRIESLQPVAREIATKLGKPLTLRKFYSFDNISTIVPDTVVPD